MSHLCPRGAEVTCCGWHRPARWLCARQCVRGFQIPKSLQPGFAGSQWDAAPGEDLLDGTLHPKTLGCCLGAATTLRSPCKGGSSSQPGAGQEHPRAPPPPCLADSRAARRTPAESLLAPAPAQPSREHGGDLPAAPARCWICGAGGDVQTHNGRGDAAPPGTKLSPASPDPRETVFRSLSSTKGCAQRPGAAGSWWEREVGPAWGHRCPAEPPRGALSMPSVHPGYHYWGRGGRSEKVQGEQWAAGTGEALGKVK